MAEPAIIVATDRERVYATLLLAFAADPPVRWAFRDPARFLASWPPFMVAFADEAFGHGTAYATADFAAVALWLPPGVHSDDEAMATLAYDGVSEAMRTDLDGFFGLMGVFHPTLDHWYLPMIGVDPAAQGRGLGSQLLRHGLAAVDRAGMPAYLEATSPRSRDLYARHGFAELGVIQHGSSPPMFPMLRNARV
jgi:GNAT superfamily N-acetyltransferase